MSPLGEKVADVLGQVFNGIYHISKEISKTDWSNPYYIQVTIYGGLNSFDDSRLTALLVLCFDNMLRLEVNPRAFRYLELQFHQRKSRTGRIDERLPTLESLIAEVREYLSLEDVKPDGEKIIERTNDTL
jgi:hypothetical protein